MLSTLAVALRQLLVHLLLQLRQLFLFAAVSRARARCASPLAYSLFTCCFSYSSLLFTCPPSLISALVSASTFCSSLCITLRTAARGASPLRSLCSASLSPFCSAPSPRPASVYTRSHSSCSRRHTALALCTHVHRHVQCAERALPELMSCVVSLFRRNAGVP